MRNLNPHFPGSPDSQALDAAMAVVDLLTYKLFFLLDFSWAEAENR